VGALTKDIDIARGETDREEGEEGREGGRDNDKREERPREQRHERRERDKGTDRKRESGSGSVVLHDTQTRERP
jgi:hypothetical protein